MDTRDFSFEVKSSTDSGQFEGLAATYGNVDHGFDRILAGAFTATIAKRGNELPILWAHDTANPVGLGELSDAREGLKVAGQLDMDVVSGREAYSRVKKRIVRGLSIGYQVPEGGATMENGIRVL